MLQLIERALRAANHDFCPQLNQYVYWLKKPIGWVVGALFFSILIGMFVGPQGYVLSFAFLSLLVLGLLWPWLSMRGIRCSVDIQRGAMREHEVANVVLKVSNFWPIPVFGLIVEGDFLQGIDAEEEPVAFALKRVSALSVNEFLIEVIPQRRGLLPCGDVVIKNGFPFGLTDVSKSITNVKPSLVWPAVETLEENPLRDGNRFDVFGAMSDRSGNDGETIGVRSWQRGDGLRNIHWAQTARSTQLMVRERQTPSTTSTNVVLDLFPKHHVGRGVHDSYETAIRVAASICNQLHQMRCRVQVVILGLPFDQPHCVGNQKGIDSLMDFLASLPTLIAQQEIVDRSELRQVSESWVHAEQVFFVGTSLSTVDTLGDRGIQPILIDVQGFIADSESWAADGVAAGNDAMLTSPETAAEQLKAIWGRRLAHVAR